MTRRHHLSGCITLLVAALGCNQTLDCGDRPLAELRKAEGDVARDRRGDEQHWASAEAGARFSWGDGLRTGKSASAELRVGENGRVLVDSETVIRFLSQAGASASTPAGLEIARGRATIEADRSKLSIRTRSGTALLEPGTRLELQPAAQGDVYRVLMGGAAFAAADGATLTVKAGQSVTVGIGLAVLESSENAARAGEASQPTAANTAAAPPAPVPDQLPDDGARPELQKPDTRLGATPQEALANTLEARTPDLVVPAGESFGVYDPRPPTSIGFSLDQRCPEGGELQIDTAAPARGVREIVALLLPGTHRYTLRCLNAGRPGKPALRGTVRVVRADGARPLPRSAPHNAIDLDGHRYRLMYQNLRPVITVSWPSAPNESAYTLTLQAPGGALKTFQSRRPEYEIQSDMVQDGTHVLVMQSSAEPSRRSKPTTVDILFDNAAPTASLESPPAAGFRADQPVEVRGLALEGTRLSIEGEPVALDERHAFTHTLTLASDKPALAVRFQHPAHGVRYYLRRVTARP
jgi:hypothetical protein